MQISQLPDPLSPLGPIILLSTLFSNTFPPSSSLNVRENFSLYSHYAELNHNTCVKFASQKHILRIRLYEDQQEFSCECCLF
jgi:hypothetical protein